MAQILLFMHAEFAVIGGVGFSLEGMADVIDTPYGSVKVWFTRFRGRRVVFIPRHGENHLPPHKVNYRALLWAVKSAGASRVISVNTVGTMSYHPRGSFFIPCDFVEFTKTRPNTFYEDKAVHVDMSQPYCPEIRSTLKGAASSLEQEVFEGVYTCAEGPHLESPAQIRMMRNFGDVVGMTGYPEVVLAKELGLCYASLCIITNPACGMSAESLSFSEIEEQMRASGQIARDIIVKALEKLPPERSCSCKDVLPQSGL